MPELPEVYTMAKGLKTLIDRKISSVWADKPSILRVVKKSEGRKILNVERKGKNIILGLDKNLFLLIHPKMTGRFLLNKHDKYERIIFNFEKNDFLTFSDKRRFAKVVLVEKNKIKKELDLLGEDALDISFKKFKNLIISKKKKIKQVLMDQGVVAGVGNIYADEILWKAKIHPKRAANSLSEKELKNIFQSMNFILKKSIKLRGVSIQDYRDVFGKLGEYQNHRLVYGRTGEKCKRCANKIQKIKIAQRSTHFCHKCQI
ncbi:MAG TPA: DNA-formamidopyrimidine glycosylase [Candidatus Paceibacterota bacterium]